MKNTVIITKKPVRSGLFSQPDGAFAGNGDSQVILGNAPDGLRIFISKTDLWWCIEDHTKGGLRPLGYIDLPVPAEMYDNYYVEMDMDGGVIRCRFSAGKEKMFAFIRVAAEENSILVSLSGSVITTPVLRVFDIGQTDGRKGSFPIEGAEGIYRSFDDEENVCETHCFAAMKKITDRSIYVTVASDHETDDPRRAVEDRISGITQKGFDRLIASTEKWWGDFRAKSSFTLSDKELELSWYASLYALACCRGNRFASAGLFPYLTVERADWHSDYHLNYNYQASFYHVCQTNHTELTDFYLAPLEAFMEKGHEFAEKFGCRGIIYPVAIGPGGHCTEYEKENRIRFERLFLGQKSNGIHTADIPVMRWRATRDLDYARDHAYPFIKANLEFFEDYLTEEKDGRLSVCDDAAHEVPIYREDFNPKKYPYLHDKNNALTLGLLRMCLTAAIDMAEALGTDEDKQEKWADMLSRLSPFSYTVQRGMTVFRYTEKGERWHGDNDVGLQHIYPCGCIGLSSDRKLLHIARNSVLARPYCYDDCNAPTSFYPMAVRVGMKAETITKRLREYNKKHRLANMLLLDGGGGLEYSSVNATTLTEMALQSYEGILRIFPNWDRSIDCEFRHLLADGNFLVSSSMKNGKCGKTEIVSVLGGSLTICPPQPHKKDSFIVTINGDKTEIPMGACCDVRGVENGRLCTVKAFTLSTDKGDVIIIE